MFHTEGDIVRAYNATKDLKNKILEFFGLYKTYANGVNDMKLSDEQIRNIYLEKMEPTSLTVILVGTEYSSYQEFVPVNDPDYEGYYGSKGPGYYQESTCSSTYTTRYVIPFHVLLKSQKELIEYLTKLKITWEAEKAEKERLRQIKIHEDALAKLKSSTAAKI